MTRNVDSLAGLLAGDDSLSDYDLWRALRAVDLELYRLKREERPVPIGMLYARRALQAARVERAAG